MAKKRATNVEYPVIGGRGVFRNKLDRRECFRLWVELGTLKKVAKYLERNGIINESKGKPITLGAISTAAKKFALFNRDEAREMWEKTYPEFNLTDDEWLDFLSRASRLLIRYHIKEYESWKEENPDVIAYENSLI